MIIDLIINNKFYNINYNIKSNFIKLLNSDSIYLGFYKRYDAILKARALNVDLIEISHYENISICKLIRWGRFKYFELKKVKVFKKKKVFSIKEIRFSLFIFDNDYNNKLIKIKKLLFLGYKVRICLSIKGRQIFKKNIIENTLSVLKDNLKINGLLQTVSKFDNKQICMYFIPK